VLIKFQLGEMLSQLDSLDVFETIDQVSVVFCCFEARWTKPDCDDRGVREEKLLMLFRRVVAKHLFEHQDECFVFGRRLDSEILQVFNSVMEEAEENSFMRLIQLLRNFEVFDEEDLGFGAFGTCAPVMRLSAKQILPRFLN